MNNGDKIKVRTEVHAGSDYRPHTVWSFELLRPIDYQESESCRTPEAYEQLGRYYSKPTQIFNLETKEVRAVSFHTAEVLTHGMHSDWSVVTPHGYPLFDIDNEMIGGVYYGETYYLDEYLLKHKHYKEYIIRHRENLIAWSLLIILMVYMIIDYYF